MVTTFNQKIENSIKQYIINRLKLKNYDRIINIKLVTKNKTEDFKKNMKLVQVRISAM